MSPASNVPLNAWIERSQLTVVCNHNTTVFMLEKNTSTKENIVIWCSFIQQAFTMYDKLSSCMYKLSSCITSIAWEVIWEYIRRQMTRRNSRTDPNHHPNICCKWAWERLDIEVIMDPKLINPSSSLRMEYSRYPASPQACILEGETK